MALAIKNKLSTKPAFFPPKIISRHYSYHLYVPILSVCIDGRWIWERLRQDWTDDFWTDAVSNWWQRTSSKKKKNDDWCWIFQGFLIVIHDEWLLQVETRLVYCILEQQPVIGPISSPLFERPNCGGTDWIWNFLIALKQHCARMQNDTHSSLSTKHCESPFVYRRTSIWTQSLFECNF